MNKNKLYIPSYSNSFFDIASNAHVKISLWHLIIDPLKILCLNWQLFFMLAVPTALLLTFSSLGFDRSSLCGIDTDLSITSKSCSENALNFYGNMTIYLLGLLIFVIKWYEYAIQKKTISIRSFFKLNKGQIKAIGVIIVFILINISPLVALTILFLRVPNPIWQKELLFFTSVAWIFLLPLIALRFYGAIAFALENQKIPSLKTFWKNTSGNMLKLLLGTAVIVFLALCLFMQYYAATQGITNISQLVIIATDFEYNILMTFFIVLGTNYCYTQKNLFFKGEDNE